MYGSLDISTSGMIAQRTRLAAIQANIANRHTILDSQGNVNPFKRRIAHFAPGDPNATTEDGRKLGVHVQQIEIDPAPVRPKEYDPSNPYAYTSGPYKGYVPDTGINPVVEQVNALEAGRAYEANVMAAEATKTMITQALRLLA